MNECLGCNAIDTGAATTTDGRVVCATCPDLMHGRVVPQSATVRALSRLMEARAGRKALPKGPGSAGDDALQDKLAQDPRFGQWAAGEQ